ncbi:MAG: hypothetical protein M0Z31_11205 [Clostridia bacterium]|nr:hypothetical protein [Clostridia bacterium]
MEQILEEILAKLGIMDSKIENLGGRFDRLETKVDSLESRFDRLETKVDNLEGRIDNLENKVDELYSLKPIIIESHQWLSTLIENKEFQKAEMDRLEHKINTVEGVLTGFDKSLDTLKKAQ